MVLFDREAIEHWIPHREPFLLVDEIVEFEAGRRADAAIGVILDFISDHPTTLMVTTSDSDAGGMQVFGEPFPADTAPARASNGAPMDGIEGTNGRLFEAAPDANGVRHKFAVAWAQYHDLSGGILLKADGLGAEQVAAETIRAVSGLGLRHFYLSNLETGRAAARHRFRPFQVPQLRPRHSRLGKRAPL